MVGGTGAPPIVARLREATDKATTKLKGMRQRGLRHSLWLFFLPVHKPQTYPVSIKSAKHYNYARANWPTSNGLQLVLYMSEFVCKMAQ